MLIILIITSFPSDDSQYISMSRATLLRAKTREGLLDCGTTPFHVMMLAMSLMTCALGWGNHLFGWCKVSVSTSVKELLGWNQIFFSLLLLLLLFCCPPCHSSRYIGLEVYMPWEKCFEVLWSVYCLTTSWSVGRGDRPMMGRVGLVQSHLQINLSNLTSVGHKSFIPHHTARPHNSFWTKISK